jgi:hypothetical protein
MSSLATPEKFANTLSLSNLTGANGFKTFGAPGRTVSVSGAGDINGDASTM